MRKELAKKHETQIMEALLAAEALRLQQAIKVEESKFVEMNDTKICPDCNKRFTSQSAFVRYPNGEVVHFSCHTRKLQSIK